MTETVQIPLLKDHHTHPSIYAAMKSGVSLWDVRETEEAINRIRQCRESFVLVQGWDDSHYSFSSSELEQLPPVFISNISLHTFLMNKSAKRLLSPTHPEIVQNLKNKDWIERNIPLMLKLNVDLAGCSRERLESFYDGLLDCGVWHAQEMLLPNQEVADLYQNTQLKKRSSIWADPKTFDSLDSETQDRIAGIKIFTDGAVGAKTAAMTEPFLNGDRGVLLRSDQELKQLITSLTQLNKPLAIHAIGDRALEQVVRVIESIGNAISNIPSIRIEHAQFISKSSARRAKDLDLTLCMQPNFSPESIGYRDRLTPQQKAQNNCFRMLIDEIGFNPGTSLIFGSDGMPHGVEYALRSSLFPPNQIQTLHLDEFIAGYCMPDLSQGSIQVEIDWKNKRLAVRSIELKS